MDRFPQKQVTAVSFLERALMSPVSGPDDPSRVPSFVTMPGEGRQLEIKAGRLVVREDGNRTAGALGIFEQTMGAGDRGPVPHYHTKMLEMFVVLEGAMRVRVDEKVIEVPAGGIACVNPGAVHAFDADPETGARFLILFSPAANRIAYFEGLQEILKSGNHDQLLQLMAEHDQYVVDDSEIKKRY